MLRSPHLVVLASLLAILSAACLELSPPPTPAGPSLSPTAVPTAVPTATAVEPTATSTSTPTATATETPTVTPTQPSLVFDPRTGLPVVPAFPPPTGQLAPSVPAGLPGAAAAPTGLPLPGAPGAPGAAAAPSPVWGCDGDERLVFTPPNPKAGEKVFIFVTAARDRAFGLIIGPQLSGVEGRPVAGGSGFKRVWEIVLPSPGIYSYQFYGGPNPDHLCVTASLEVPAAAPIAPVSPTATATATTTPTPVSAPRPDH